MPTTTHYDEAAPHCHIILLPLVEGRMQGSGIVGNRTRLQAMQTDFYESVGQPHGLSRPKAAQRLSAATRAKSASLALTALQSDAGLMDRPDVEAAMPAAIGRDPVALLAALSLSVPHPPKSKKTFVQIMTKPCTPEKPIGFAGRSKPIGFDAQGAEKERTLSCVGFAPESPPITSPKPLQTAFHDDEPDVADDYSRVRDSDESAGSWDSEIGEFVRVPVRVSSVRREAQEHINKALAARFHRMH
ncbi:MAG: plasmid recombination protein [Betaproteobacteria bacterium]|nr:plasmid recombination protein [Betaproteobacteria bacterium]